MKKLLAAVFVLCSLFSLSAQDLKSQGEDFFLQNNPSRALPLFEAALLKAPSDEELFLYIGICYEQLGLLDKARATYSKALTIAVDRKGLFYYNLGNIAFMKGEYDESLKMYDTAALYNPGYPSLYLHRGQTRLQLQDKAGAITDYSQYLVLNPASKQKENIEKVISLLGQKIQDEELALQLEEQRKLEEEAQRLADEQRRLEEERRRQELLNSVLSSLDNSTGDTQNLSAGTEDIENVDEDFELAD